MSKNIWGSGPGHTVIFTSDAKISGQAISISFVKRSIHIVERRDRRWTIIAVLPTLKLVLSNLQEIFGCFWNPTAYMRYKYSLIPMHCILYNICYRLIVMQKKLFRAEITRRKYPLFGDLIPNFLECSLLYGCMPTMGLTWMLLGANRSLACGADLDVC